MNESTLFKKTADETLFGDLDSILGVLEGAHDGDRCAEPFYANIFSWFRKADNALEGAGLHHTCLMRRPILHRCSKQLHEVATALLECYGGVLGTILNGVPYNYKKINANGLIIGSKLKAYATPNISGGCMELDNFYRELFQHCDGIKAYLPVSPQDIRQNLYFAYDERTFYDAIKEGLFYNPEIIILFDPMGTTTWHKTATTALTVSGGVLIKVEGFYTTKRSKLEGTILNFNQVRNWDWARFLYSKCTTLGITPTQSLEAAANFNYYSRYLI